MIGHRRAVVIAQNPLFADCAAVNGACAAVCNECKAVTGDFGAETDECNAVAGECRAVVHGGMTDVVDPEPGIVAG